MATTFRTLSRCSLRLRGPVARSVFRPARVHVRPYSSAHATPTAPAAAALAPGSIAPFVAELDKIAPAFDIDGAQVRVIQAPAEFYQTLKVCMAGER